VSLSQLLRSSRRCQSRDLIANTDNCYRGFIPPVFNPDSAAQNEDVERMTRSNTQHDAHRLTIIQSASGISFKSQFLYLIVYITRYIDLLWTFYLPASLYNTVFKIVFISTSAYTVYLMLNDYKPTHDPNLDTFKVQYLLAASAVLAILFPYEYKFHEVGRTRNMLDEAANGMDRFSGHSPSGSSLSRFFLNYSCCSGLVKRKQSQRTTYLPSARTALCTFRIGSTATSPRLAQRVSTTQFR
jgi:hypothetical protein